MQRSAVGTPRRLSVQLPQRQSLQWFPPKPASTLTDDHSLGCLEMSVTWMSFTSWPNFIKSYRTVLHLALSRPVTLRNCPFDVTFELSFCNWLRQFVCDEFHICGWRCWNHIRTTRQVHIGTPRSVTWQNWGFRQCQLFVIQRSSSDRARGKFLICMP